MHPDTGPPHTLHTRVRVVRATCAHTRVRACPHSCEHAHSHSFIHACTHARARTHACMRARTCILCMCARVRVQVWPKSDGEKPPAVIYPGDMWYPSHAWRNTMPSSPHAPPHTRTHACTRVRICTAEVMHMRVRSCGAGRRRPMKQRRQLCVRVVRRLRRCATIMGTMFWAAYHRQHITQRERSGR